MTYNEFIQNIINTRGQWNIPEGEYFELHHIVPSCLGGEGDYLDRFNHSRFYQKSHHLNCIWLYPAEHYIAHSLLALENPTNYKLQFAWNMMNNLNNRVILEEEYSTLKRQFSNSRKSFRYSDDSKKKMSLAKKGKPGKKWTEENKIKLSLKYQGQNNPMYGKEPWNKGIPAKNRKKIICIETNVVYNSIHEASDATGIPETRLVKVCKGKRNIAGGYHWKYYND